MAGIHVANEVTINHRQLGREVWEWSAEEQAKFLTGFAEIFKADPSVGLMQISYICDALRSGDGNLGAVQWLSDHLTEYLKED